MLGICGAYVYFWHMCKCVVHMMCKCAVACEYVVHMMCKCDVYMWCICVFVAYVHMFVHMMCKCDVLHVHVHMFVHINL